MSRARAGAGRPLLWMALLAVFFTGLRACGHGAVPPAPPAELPPEYAGVVPDSAGADFAAPPETRRIRLADGQLVHEGHVQDALEREGLAGQWSAFTWQVGERTVATIAPGLDRRHHFASAYLVGYVPFAGVDDWVPLAALAQRKSYRYDHDLYRGANEVWQTSREAFYFPQGDCEDHAIALADWLIGLGHDARVVIGRARGEGHAWVVLLDGDRTYLLESTLKRPGRALPLAAQFPDYRPEAMFDRERYWVNAGSTLTADYRGGHWQLRSRFRRG